MTSPTNPKTDDPHRVAHGGSWYNTSASIVRAAYRLKLAPTFRDDTLGFRTTQSGCRRKGVTPP